VTVIDLFDQYDVRMQPERGVGLQGSASTKQLKALEGMGFPVPEGITRREASAIISKAFARRDQGLVYRPKVIRQLKRHGYDYTNMSIDQAKSIMDQLAKNGWKPIARIASA